LAKPLNIRSVYPSIEEEKRPNSKEEVKSEGGKKSTAYVDSKKRGEGWFLVLLREKSLLKKNRMRNRGGNR